MKVIEEFDWAEMWRKALEESSLGQRAEKPEYCDERADQFEGAVKQSNRRAMFISRIEVKPDYKVIDICASPGSVAIPLAKIVKCVTAVEGNVCSLKGECIKGASGKYDDHKQEMGRRGNREEKRSVYIFAGAGRKKSGQFFGAAFHHGKTSPDYIRSGDEE